MQKTKVTNGYGLNIYDLIYHEKLLISKAALEELNQLLDPQREKSDNSDLEIKAEVQEKPKAKKTAKPKVEKIEEVAELEAAPVDQVESAETENVENVEATNNE